MSEVRRQVKRYCDTLQANLYETSQLWMESWRKIASRINPDRGRFTIGYLSATSKSGGVPLQISSGVNKRKGILDNYPTKASEILANGICSGIIPMGQKWFYMSGGVDPSKEEDLYLDKLTETLLNKLQSSNFYSQMRSFVLELSLFGTAVILPRVKEDGDISWFVPTIGEYMLIPDSTGGIDGIMMYKTMTSAQVIDVYGIENVSKNIKDDYENPDKFKKKWWVICEVWERNREGDSFPNMKVLKDAPYRYVAFEAGVHCNTSSWRSYNIGSEDDILNIAPLYQKEFFAGRWEVISTDIYGKGVGFKAMTSVEKLYKFVNDGMEAFELAVKPPLVASANLLGRDQVVNTNPDGITVVDGALRRGEDIIRPIFQNNGVALQAYPEYLRLFRDAVAEDFYVPMFEMFQDVTKRMSATEAMQLSNEQKTQLSNIISRIENDVLEPLVVFMANYLVSTGDIDPYPESLQGKDTTMQFMGVLSISQRRTEMNPVNEMIGVIAAVAQMNPEVLDKVDFDTLLDKVSKATGVSPDITRSNEEVRVLREARAQAMAQQQELENAKTATEAARNMQGLTDEG